VGVVGIVFMSIGGSYSFTESVGSLSKVVVKHLCAILRGLLVVPLFTSCTADPASESASLIGAWRSTIQFETGAFAEITDLEFMYVFNAGGTLTESSNYDSAPPVPPAYGVWRTVGPNEFEAKYEFFSTVTSDLESFTKGAGWVPSGHGVFTERIKLSADGQTFTSTIRYEAFGLQNESLEGGGNATAKAVRIRF